MQKLRLIASRPTAAAVHGLRALATTTASASAATPGASKEPPARPSPLHALHQRHAGRLVPFAGYALPVQYARHGIAASHRHCRRSAALFDVSHMQQTRLRGADAVACFESVCTADVAAGLSDGGAALTVLTTPAGGIVDDLIVTRVAGDELFVVSNAGRRAEDRVVLEEAVRAFRARGADVSVEFVDSGELALLALQGPRAVQTLQRLTETGVDLGQLWFMRSRTLTVAGVPGCRVSRCGYTGEDGVEISVPADRVEHLAEALLAVPRTDAEVDADERQLAGESESDAGDGYTGGVVRLAGLGARDSLRLEAGMCLYGSDIDEGTNPVEAGLAWLVAKRRRAEANFPGAAAILAALRPGGCQKRRVGVRMPAGSGPPARHGVPIVTSDGDGATTVIGSVTSGCPSPTLGGCVAMGYVTDAHKAVGGRVRLDIRGRLYDAEVVRMPFVPARYHQQPKQ